MDFLAPAVFVGVLFILLRQIERWLHQHIFKVGWLLTHNYETTTILYYTIFLPGVVLHEVTYWLMAGILNVRADRSIRWPEKQEIGNLQLNFIKLSPKANPLKKAIIAATPLITGLLAIWVIAVNIFDLETIMIIAASGRLEDIANAIKVLTGTTDFWLWFYISFTIANTMFPTISKDMRGWWQIGGALGVILISLLILNIGQNLLSELTLSLGQFLNSLSLILMLTITINITMVILLGAIESTIERITGHSATFHKGKMITMTREEALKLKQEKSLTTRATPRRKTAVSNLVSIYALEFPIPGPPGQEPVTKGIAAVLGMATAGDLPDTTEEDDIVETTATDSTRQRMLKLFSDGGNKTADTDDIPALSSSTPSPLSTPPTEDFEDTKAKSKADSENKPKSPHIDDDESIKRATAKLDAGVKSDSKIESDGIKTSSPSPNVPKQKSKINIPPKTPSKVDDGEQPATHPPRRASIFDDIAESTPSTINDSEKDKGKDTPPQSPKIPARRSKLNVPKTPDNIGDIDDDDEQLSTRLPRRTSIFDDIAQSDSSTDENVEEDAKEKTQYPAPEFSRPFARQDVLESDESKEIEDESLTAQSSQFQRPFASPEKSKARPTEEKDKAPSRSAPSSWRSQFASTPETTDNMDDEEDEQLSTRLPRRSSLFDSLNAPSTDSDSKDKKKEPAQTTSPSWRSQLTSTPKTTDDSIDDDDDDEQLPRTGSLLRGLGRPRSQQPRSTIRGSGSHPAPKPTPKSTQDNPQQSMNNWRSQLNSDEDEDEELSYEPIDDEIFYDDDNDDYYDDDNDSDDY